MKHRCSCISLSPKDTIFRKLLPSVFAPGLLVRWVKLGLGRTCENGFFDMRVKIPFNGGQSECSELRLGISTPILSGTAVGVYCIIIACWTSSGYLTEFLVLCLSGG